jgi:SulP family sulfate permease
MARTRYRAATTNIPLRDLPAAALRAVLREGYSLAELKQDLLAGLVVGVVALPLAMALAIAVGVPPQQGLYTSIVAGFVAAALGGSRTQVSGPTAAFIVVLAPIYAKFGLAGLLISGLLGGLILVAMGLARLGRLITFIPHPVTTGFTAGIATVIATLQLKDLLGLTLATNPDHYVERVLAMVAALGTASGWEFSIGAFTLAVLLVLPRRTRRVPAPIVALPAAGLLAALLDQLVPGFEVATIASRFQTTVDGVTVAGIPQLPPLPVLPWLMPGPDGAPFQLSFETFRTLLASAFAVAMLAAIESLLSAVVADGLARTKHDPDSELLAIGTANVIAPFFAGIPATGAIARTATNVRSGARSPIAAMTHAVVVLGAILVLAPALGHLPMASLAALLLLVAWNMSEVGHFVHTVRVAPKSDVTVLLTCYVLTVGFDMVIGVTVGVVLAAFLFMRRMAEVTEIRLAEAGQHEDLPGPIPRGVTVYDISGPLFFGAAQKAMSALDVLDSNTAAVILLMDGVSVMDATGLVALESALTPLARNKCMVLLCGVREQPKALLKRAQLEKRANVVFCQSTREALDRATAAVEARAAQAPKSSLTPQMGAP